MTAIFSYIASVDLVRYICSRWMTAIFSYIASVDLVRSLPAEMASSLACLRILAILEEKRPSRALTSSAAARLFSLRIIFSLPRALADTEKRWFMSFWMRFSSPLTWRFTRAWAALWEITSADTIWTSPVSLVSMSRMVASVAAREVAKSLRAPLTWSAASLRAALMSLTVLEKRESERAACLAMESLISVMAPARSLSRAARCLPMSMYILPNLSSAFFSAAARALETASEALAKPLADLASAALMSARVAFLWAAILPCMVAMLAFMSSATSL